MAILVTFGSGFAWIDFSAFGERYFWTAGMLGLIAALPRCYYICILFVFGYYNINMRGDYAAKWQKIGIIMNASAGVVLLIYRFVIIGNDKFFDLTQNNMFVIVWLPVELLFKCVVDPIYVFFELWSSRKKEDAQMKGEYLPV
jgi:hypothetical protein